ncbi:MAG: class B sortase, partial [Firmicutes bacterium]|nr:class B sortase [Bacillota bacterium]
GEAPCGVLPQFAALHDQNPDLAGWLTIPGTPVDYPVMYTPNDRDYYLRRAFDGSDAASGTLFIATPWTEGHTLVYGHHMKNGTMFSDLIHYQDKAFYDDHKIVHLDTLEGYGQYEIVIVFKTVAYSNAAFNYFDYINFDTQEVFDKYISTCKSLQLYDTGVEAQYGDKLITLSTCEYSKKDGRLVVVARKIA